MCGIAAVADVRPGPDRRAEAARIGAQMLDRLRHRGPDGRGDHRAGSTWLGHTRLAIVDLPGGAQPMTSDDGWWVVANGEIYNHEAVRTELAAAGRALRTSSDSEVVLHAIAAWGTAGVSRLRGMFAFVVVGPDGRVVLGRDPLGIKPLYWARRGDRTVVASELGAFPADHRGDVEEFPPGHTWTASEGLRPVVDLHEDPVGAGSARPFETRGEAVAAIREAVLDAVRQRMMADVPLGVFLSGGLDSSIVAAAMAREAAPGTVIRSFSAGTPDSPDLAAARRVAAYLGFEHHERVYTDDEVLDVLPDVVRATESYEPSLIRSAVPNYLLSELAARHVKVVLTGEGADELFAGYHHLRGLPPERLREELERGLDLLHHLNLQRADRVSMAHGLEARVPFLALEVVAVAQRVPVEWKLLGEDGQSQAQEKALLREAFAGWLPDDILWRRKEQFGDGSGTAAVMARRAASLVPEAEWASHALPGMPRARTREELGYQRIFAEHLGGVRAERVLGRWPEA